MEEIQSLAIEPSSQPQLGVITEQSHPIKFQEHFMEFSQKLYSKKQDVIDRFLMAENNRKLTKRKYIQARLTYKVLKKEMFTLESSDSDIEYDLTKNKV